MTESTNQITIRQAVEADAQYIYEIHSNAVHTTAAGDYELAIREEWSPLLASRVPQLAAKIRGNNESIMLVAEIEGKVVGFGEIAPSKSELRAVYVSPAAGRKGVGKALLKRIEAIARKLHVSRLWLDSSLTAEKFYAANGYSSDGEGEHTLQTGRIMRCVKMSKTL
jgi:putative acetyltransferase